MAPRAETLHRAELHGDVMGGEMGESLLDRPVPLEAQIAVARHHRQSRPRLAELARSVAVELHGAETEGEAVAHRHRLGAEDVAIELARNRPVGDVDDAVVERDMLRHRLLPGRWGPQPRSRSTRAFSRSQVRCFSVSRLSCSFLPRARPSSTLARPRSLK